MSITQGTAPLTLAFTNTSTGDGLEYYWDFGDGNTSTLRNPTHTFVNVDVYSVTLTVKNASGQTDQASQTISATAAGGGNGYGGGNGNGNGYGGGPPSS